jgi:ATP-dependent Clp protease ATP-binding subunit ClpA
MTDSYIVYNSVLDNFVRIRKLNSTEIEHLLTTLKVAVKSPKFRITQYVDFIVKAFVEGHVALCKAGGEDAATSLFECTCEVYPDFSIELLNKTLNGVVPDIKKEASAIVTGLTLPQIGSIEKRIKTELIGQDEAVAEVIKGVKLMSSGLEGLTSLFFIGPTGVGKTEMAKLLAKHYLGGNKRLLKINCAEYSSSHEYSKLIGSPPGYIGHNEKGILTECADKSSQWVILFDEIEKASPKLHNLLLGLLDDGKITDSHGTDLDFSKSMILFTSNVGVKDVVTKKTMGFGAEKPSFKDSKEEIMDSFKDTFSPEFINRLDVVVHFNTLNKDDAKRIARINLKHLPIRCTKKLVDWVVEGSFSEDYGARNIKRFIKNNITLKVADRILEGHPDTIFSPVFNKDELIELKLPNAKQQD